MKRSNNSRWHFPISQKDLLFLLYGHTKSSHHLLELLCCCLYWLLHCKKNMLKMFSYHLMLVSVFSVLLKVSDKALQTPSWGLDAIHQRVKHHCYVNTTLSDHILRKGLHSSQMNLHKQGWVKGVWHHSYTYITFSHTLLRNSFYSSQMNLHKQGWVKGVWHHSYTNTTFSHTLLRNSFYSSHMK